MATQLTSTPPNSPVLSPKRPPRIETSRIDISQIKEEPPVRLPVGGLVEDTFDSTSPKHPPVPPNTPVKAPVKTSVQFGSRDSSSRKSQDTEDKGRSILGTASGLARGAVQGTVYGLLSNIITVPAGLIMAVTGVGLPAAFATWILGPLAAGAWGAYRGYQGSL